MEAAKESEPSRILDVILPPCLEVDSREGSALSPESSQDTLARAAATMKSHAASIFTLDHRDDCVAEGLTDIITGEPLGGHELDQPCTTENGSSGGRGQVGGDMVVPALSGEGDEVVVGKGAEEDDRGACVDGLQGLEIGERGQNSGGDKEGGDEEPILVLGVV